MILSPSICTGGYAKVAETLAWLESQGCDRIHIDIMDGRFVRPIMGGTDYVNMIRNAVSLPIELHFMTYEPEKMLDMYELRPGEVAYMHADTTKHPHRLLQSLRARGAVPGLALNSYEEPEDAEELLDEADAILLMGVRAGQPASKFYWSVLDKCRKLREMAAARGRSLFIEVDGSVSPDNICQLAEGGLDGVVLGYPGCFDPVTGREKRLALMKELIRKAENNTLEVQ